MNKIEYANLLGKYKNVDENSKDHTFRMYLKIRQ